MECKENNLINKQAIMYPLKIFFVFLLISISLMSVSAQSWISLNGTGEVKVNDSNSLDNFSKATWNMWINQNVYNANAGIAGKYRAVTGGRSYIIRTSLTNGSSISVILSKDGINNGFYTSLSSKQCGVRKNGEWTMITLTYDGNLITYYRNGIKCDSDTTVLNSIYNSSSPLRLGAGNSVYFNGGIDEYAFYEQNLSDMQIERLYNESQYGKKLGKSIPVLVYHITDNINDPIAVNDTNFKQQMKLLYDNNFETVTMKEYNEWREGNFSMPEKPVLIIFDDGFSTVYKNAKPVLDQYGFVATVAIVTRYASFTSNSSGYMRWEELNNLKNSGWDLQSHSITHSHMLRLNQSQFRYELLQSREIIENKTGKEPTSFIFPFHESNSTYTQICGEYYSLCWTQGSYYPTYNYISTDGKKYMSLRRININNSISLPIFASHFGKDMNFAGKWNMEEGSGSTTEDSSGRGNTGYLLAGANWVSGTDVVSAFASLNLYKTAKESLNQSKKDKKEKKEKEDIDNIIDTDKGKSSMNNYPEEKIPYPDNMDIEGYYYATHDLSNMS